MRARLVPVLALSLLAVWCRPARADAPRKADLSRLVVVGDSLSAGFQSGSLVASAQPHGYASLVAAQAGVPLALPLIRAPGIPNVLTLVDPGPPPVIVPAPGVSPGRVDPTVQAMNLAVPLARVRDALETRPICGSDNSTDFVNFTGFILGLPEPCLGFGAALSQVEWAEVLAPTTILVWLGGNDVLGAVMGGDASLRTPVEAFADAYRQVLDRLAATGATLVVANLADVTVVPFLTSAEAVAAGTGLPLEVVGPLLGIGPGDFVTPEAAPLIELILAGAVPGPLPANVVLDAQEVAAIRASVEAYNTIIEAEAAAHGAALVDIRALFDRVAAEGYVVGGQRLTTAFLGGVFSLDGLHPTDTAYAVIANEFIRALNTRFGAGIPPVQVRQVERADPLVLPGVGRPDAALGSVDPETAASLRKVIGGGR